jgi:hypothetical protein
MHNVEASFVKSTSLSDSKQSPRLVKLLYNHNPFYLISAGLVLYGVRNTIQEHGQDVLGPWTLAGLFAGYIGLLALTSFLIVRLGRVWDDARSIFMVILLLFFGLSVSFDSLCQSSPDSAALMLTIGFAFSVLVTEAILWSLKIKFPPLFRIPCYLMLAATFFYPLVIVAQQSYFLDVDARWLLAGFPVLCGVAILTLLPAIRKGSGYVAKNGTPWVWPMFPFAAFVLLVVGLCGRAMLLTMAFDPSVGVGSIFGSYMVLPIVFACIVVLIEIGIVEKIKAVQSLGLFLIPCSIFLAMNWSSDVGQATFYSDVTATIGAPVWIAICVSIFLIGICAVRKIDGAETMLSWVLIGSLFVTTEGKLVSGLSEIAVWPSLVLAILSLRTTEFRKRSQNWMFAALWMTPLIAKSTGVAGFPEIRFAVAFHWLLFATCMVGFSFRDQFAQQLRIYGAAVLPVLSAGAMVYAIGHSEAHWFVLAYIGCLTMFAMIFFYVCRDKIYLWVANIVFGIGLLTTATIFRGNISIETRGLAGFMLLGTICFVMGVFVSCLKAGLGPRIQKQYRQFMAEVHDRFGIFDGDNEQLSSE